MAEIVERNHGDFVANGLVKMEIIQIVVRTGLGPVW